MSTNGAQMFRSQYYNDPRPMGDAIFTTPIQTYDHLPTEEGILWEVFVGVDTANTQNERSDWTAISVGYRTPLGRMYIEHTQQGRWTWEQAALEIIRIAFEHEPKKIGIEVQLQANFLSIWIGALQDAVREYRAANGHDPPLIPEPTFVTQRAIGKEQRVGAVFGPAYRRGVVLIKATNADLIAQMASFPQGRHDDLVDSATILLQIARIQMSTSAAYHQARVEEQMGLPEWRQFGRRRKTGYAYGELFANYPA